MLRHFLTVWVLYWAVVALLPVHSIYPATTEAFLLQLSFVALVTICGQAALSIYKVRQMPECGRFDIACAPQLIAIGIAMSIVGLAALMYDKIFIQGIDYSEGLAVAREQWRVIGEEREGQASSIFSAMGYFLGSAYYVSAVLAVTQTRVVSARARTITLFTCFCLLVANSMLTGGRSSILLIAPIVVSAYGARRGATAYLRANKTQRRIVMVLALLAGAYGVFVFYQRAAAGDLDALEYALDFLPFLGLEADDWYRSSLGSGPLDALSAMLVLATAYVTHSFATVAAIIDAPLEDKTIIFKNIATLLYKLGLADYPQSDWFLAGKAPSVPGVLWHQFGTLGFVTGSMVLGFMSGLTKVWTVRKPSRLLPLGAYTLAETTLMLSPFEFAPDFLSFPFVLISFVTLAGIAWLMGNGTLRAKARHPVQAALARHARPTAAP
jgi:hypothetical protein